MRSAAVRAWYSMENGGISAVSLLTFIVSGHMRKSASERGVTCNITSEEKLYKRL